MIRHYVNGNQLIEIPAGESQIEILKQVLEEIINDFGLTKDEVERTVLESSDTRQFSDEPSFKRQFLRAVDQMKRNSKE